MVTALDACTEPTVRPVDTLTVSSPMRITTVIAVAPLTQRVKVRSDDRGEPSRARRAPRARARNTNTIVTTNTTVVTVSITVHKE